MKWIRQIPEQESGDYWFAGRCIATRGVVSEIPQDEIIAIVRDVQKVAQTSGGIDYMQTYIHQETQRKIWVIDQVMRSTLQSGDHPPEHNYFTILFPEEY